MYLANIKYIKAIKKKQPQIKNLQNSKAKIH